MCTPLPFPVLIGDVGGTNARFAQINDPREPMERFPNVRTADHASFAAVAGGTAGRFPSIPALSATRTSQCTAAGGTTA